MSADEQWMDTEANAFAAFLLMPPNLFDPVMQKGINLDDDRWLQRVASKFHVPIGAVIYRIWLEGKMS